MRNVGFLEYDSDGADPAPVRRVSVGRRKAALDPGRLGGVVAARTRPGSSTDGFARAARAAAQPLGTVSVRFRPPF